MRPIPTNTTARPAIKRPSVELVIVMAPRTRPTNPRKLANLPAQLGINRHIGQFISGVSASFPLAILSSAIFSSSFLNNFVLFNGTSYKEKPI